VSGDTARTVPPTAPATRTAEFPCFDGLRAVAAMTIVVFHVAASTGTTTATSWGDYFARLDVGVSVFFVISGFLLYRPFALAHFGGRPTSRWRDFWWRRALRIYPAYWVALTAAILLFHSTNLHGFADYLRHYALVQIYTPGYGLGGIVPTWSLAVEVSFYAALPLYAWLLGRLTRRASGSRALSIEAGAAGFLYALGLGVRAFLFYHDRPGTVSAQWLPAEADLFALGIALAVFSAASTQGTASRPTEWFARALRWLGTHQYVSWLSSAAAFAIVCNIGLQTDFAVGVYHRKAEMAHQILYGFTAFFLVLPAVFGEQHRGFGRGLLRSRVFTAVGVVSYGVFLWHFDWVNQLDDWGLVKVTHGLRFPLVLAVAAVLTLATAAASWFLVERPILARKYQPPWRPAAQGVRQGARG
jgi:peptidoglycan/LPS O-acetylase OafA/YrhL